MSKSNSNVDEQLALLLDKHGLGFEFNNHKLYKDLKALISKAISEDSSDIQVQGFYGSSDKPMKNDDKKQIRDFVEQWHKARMDEAEKAQFEQEIHDYINSLFVTKLESLKDQRSHTFLAPTHGVPIEAINNMITAMKGEG